MGMQDQLALPADETAELARLRSDLDVIERTGAELRIRIAALEARLAAGATALEPPAGAA